MLGFTRHGAKEFQAITKAEYDRGQLVAGLHHTAGQLNQVYAQHNAIVLDNKLQATPYIDYTDNALSLGIAGAQAVISQPEIDPRGEQPRARPQERLASVPLRAGQLEALRPVAPVRRKRVTVAARNRSAS